MSNYSFLERSIAKSLGHFPVLKRLLKAIYARMVYFKHRKTYSIKCNYAIHSVDYGDAETFFGYYDKSPLNTNSKVIFLATDYSTKNKPSSENEVKLIVQDINSKEVINEHDIKAYNWQQGCRSHWLTDDLYIFNDFNIDTETYMARIWSVQSKSELWSFDYPVQDSFKCDYYLSLNYRRLLSLRPDYGYRNLPSLNVNELQSINDDGIWKVTIADNKCELLISLSSIVGFFPVDEMNKALHKVNHVMISPEGDRFLFLHRYYIGKRRVDRLLLADAENGDLSLIANFGMVSHYTWLDNDNILAYLRGPDYSDGYWKVNLSNLKFDRYLSGNLDKYGDGHPHSNDNWMVTDTYPDKSRMQHLLLVNSKEGSVEQLAELKHGFEFSGETRCDLHPRLSLDGCLVFFDTVYSGKRKLCYIERES